MPSYRFFAIVSSIAYCLAPGFMGRDAGREAAVLNAVVRDMIGMVGAMPNHMRWAVVLLTYLADCYPLPTRLRRFSRLPRAERLRAFDRLRASRIVALRRLARFHETLFAMQLHARAEVVAPSRPWS